MRLLFLFLAGCPGTTKPTPDTGADDTAPPTETAEDTSPPLAYDVTSAELTTALAWTDGAVPYAGYSGTGTPSGFWLADPLGDPEQAFIYLLPWGADGALIEDAASLTLTTGPAGPDKIGYEDGRLSIPDAAADVGDWYGAGIAYQLTEPTASGELSDLALITVRGAHETGYTGRAIMLDADGDGSVDDLAVGSGVEPDYDPDHLGEIGIWLDVAAGIYDWSSADFHFPACAAVDRVLYGPVDFAIDAASGSLWVACPAANYESGVAEAYSVPMDAASEPAVTVRNVGGWTLSPDPRGGVWAGAQGGERLVYATESGDVTDYTGPGIYGAAPVVVEASTGQILMAVGSQARRSGVAPPATVRGRFAPGELGADGGDSESAVHLCDVTDIEAPTCATYHTAGEGIPCIGAVQALVEVGGTLWLGSAGWLSGSGTGCGVQMWSLSPALL